MKKKVIIVLVVLVVLVAGVIFGVLPAMRRAQFNEHYELGNTYLEAEDYAAAIAEFSQCINCIDSEGDGYYALAQTHYANDDLETALEIARAGYDKTYDADLYYYVHFLEEKVGLSQLTLPYWVEEAICAYYDLLDHEEITQEMIESVTSLQISVPGAHYEDEQSEEPSGYYIEAAINDSPFGLCNAYIRKTRYEELYLKKVENDWLRDKFDWLYILKDPSDPEWTPEDLEIMYEKFPIIKEFGAMYICDSDIKAREIRELWEILWQWVFEPEAFIVPKKVDLRALRLLPNLEYVEYWIDERDVEDYPDLDTYKEKRGLELVRCPVEIIERVDKEKIKQP